MKKPLAIVTIAILTILFIFACSSTIRTANTSFVTITIGGDAGKATLHAEGATPWARFKYFLADAKLMPEAYAYIPSVVQVLVVTVSAADMTTPIVGIGSVSSNQTTATIRIEAPNGNNRQFIVEGIRGVDSQTYYRGTTTADLSGADVDLPISMNFVGPGIYVDPSLTPATADQPTCGTQASPCATITYVLNTRPSTTNNDVILALAGTFKPGTVATQETFPLQLKQGMVLLCRGTNFSSVIDVSTANATAILGNNDVAIDNCMIKVGLNSNGINDQSFRTKINGAYIELSGSPSVPPIIGAILSNDNSVLLESTVTGSGASLSVYGVQVNGGKPSIIGNTISNLPYGVRLETGAGDALITGSLITGNSTGINMLSTNKPTISLNSINNSSGTGIFVSAGSPAITGNTIHNNSVGLDVEFSAASPAVKSNSFFCNTNTDFFSNKTPGLDIRDNAWDHDLTTSPSGTLGPTDHQSVNGTGDCGLGVDICWQNSPPDFTRNNAAVPAPPACR